MFRAQVRLLTPTEHGDRSSRRWGRLGKSGSYGSQDPLSTMEDPEFSRCPHLPEDPSPSSDGVRGSPWTLNTSPKRDWKAERRLKQKYSLRKKLFQKGTYFPLILDFS